DLHQTICNSNKYFTMLSFLYSKCRHSKLQTKLYVGLFVITSFWAILVLANAFNAKPSTSDLESRQALRQLAAQLNLTFSVISNTKRNHTARITLRNPLSGVWLGAGIRWRLYFSLMRPVHQVIDGPFRLTHQNGYLHQLEPVGDLATGGLAPGGEYSIRYVGKANMLGRFDAFPNWYAVLVNKSGLEVAAEVLAVTASEALDFVNPLTRPEQYKTGPDDVNEPWTPFKRAEIQAGYLGNERPGPQLVRLVPKPALAEPLGGEQRPPSTDCLLAGLNVASSSSGGDSSGCKPAGSSEAAGLLREAAAEAAAAAAGGPCTAGEMNLPRWTASLQLCDNSSSKFGKLLTNLTPGQASEAYELLLDPKSGQAVLSAATPVGLFWAAQSLVSLLQPGGRLAVRRLFDYPRSQYRGLMLDVARNFLSVEEVVRLIDAMSAWKLNRLHLHLSDDEGLRLPLTAAFPAASRRCHPLSGEASDQPVCAQPPQLGSHPTQWGAPPGCGSYSAQDYAAILRHSASRFVRVVPELDTPAHSLAAILAMKAQGVDLTDPEDPGGQPSPQAFTNNSVNPCLPAGAQYILDLMRGVSKLHAAAGLPMLEYHFGGDEAPNGTWTNSPACRRMLSIPPDQPVDADAVSRVNLRRLLAEAADAGVDALLGWSDGFAGADLRPFNLSSLTAGIRRPRKVVAVPWHLKPSPRDLAVAGYSLVMAPATRLYLDHRQEPDPEERGLYWAANFTDLYTVFSYDAKTDAAAAGPDADILGISGALWTETARQPAQAFSLLAPRVLALAERAWHHADWEGAAPTDGGQAAKARSRDYAEFVSSVGHRELGRLASFGIQFRLAPPGARRLGGDSGGFLLTHELPGVRLFYSLESGATRRWVESDRLVEWPSGVRRVHLMAAFSLPGHKAGYYAQSRIVHIDR
ncbi:hypothetical protein BOX15_Mlig027712g2, partial [Macrostomum lignano]